MKFTVLLFPVIAAFYGAIDAPVWLRIGGLLWLALCLAAAAWFIGSRIRPAPDAEPFYDYGRCNGHLARRHRVSGQVDLGYHAAGLNGIPELHWSAFHPDHWPNFTPGHPTDATARAPAARHSPPSSCRVPSRPA